MQCAATESHFTWLKRSEAYLHVVSSAVQATMFPDGDEWKSVWILRRTVLYSASRGLLSCEVGSGCIFHSG